MEEQKNNLKFSIITLFPKFVRIKLKYTYKLFEYCILHENSIEERNVKFTHIISLFFNYIVQIVKHLISLAVNVCIVLRSDVHLGVYC